MLCIDIAFLHLVFILALGFSVVGRIFKSSKSSNATKPQLLEADVGLECTENSRIMVRRAFVGKI